MRRGAAATTRSLAQQAVGADEIARSAEALARMVNSVATAMAEQATAATDMAGASAKQIKSVTTANRSHSEAAAALLQDLTELRRTAERQAGAARQTRTGSEDVVRQAGALTSTVGELAKKPH